MFQGKMQMDSLVDIKWVIDQLREMDCPECESKMMISNCDIHGLKMYVTSHETDFTLLDRSDRHSHLNGLM